MVTIVTGGEDLQPGLLADQCATVSGGRNLNYLYLLGMELRQQAPLVLIYHSSNGLHISLIWWYSIPYFHGPSRLYQMLALNST
eukprot:1159389-Pelagomonas_calceolata.AAC.7